ncbi:Reverse transcriptase RNA-dependent DNA polymerase [Trinorchestia longiramus]|nr:Reverse transcriptase RNA-dependent DNA polymerase [Trinorchestia longiramus]
MNKTILEAVRAMVSDSKLPKTFWAEAVSTAVHIKNRSPTSTHKDLTPYQALNGHKPSVQHFRTFGCMAYAHVPKDEREKLDLKSKTCVLLGYGSETKGYRLWDFNAKKVLLSRDVVFNEFQFMSFEKEPSKEIECVPCSFPQEEKHEDSEGESELRRSTRNRAAPNRFGEWVCFAQDKFDVPANVEEDGHLKQLGFKQSKNDACIYARISNKGLCIIAMYVDDIIIASDCIDEINKVKSCLSAK